MQKNTRTEELIADFKNGYAAGWYMAIGKQFANELDIKLVERSRNNERYLAWTQGPYYSFTKGNIFYSNTVAYEKTWGESLKCLKLVCLVTKANPCKLDENKRFVDGFVEIDLFRTNNTKTNLEPYKTIRTTQTELVEFLKTGKIPK